jgi:hypothetical protein
MAYVVCPTCELISSKVFAYAEDFGIADGDSEIVNCRNCDTYLRVTVAVVDIVKDEM